MFVTRAGVRGHFDKVKSSQIVTTISRVWKLRRMLIRLIAGAKRMTELELRVSTLHRESPMCARIDRGSPNTS